MSSPKIVAPVSTTHSHCRWAQPGHHDIYLLCHNFITEFAQINPNYITISRNAWYGNKHRDNLFFPPFQLIRRNKFYPFQSKTNIKWD